MPDRGEPITALDEALAYAPEPPAVWWSPTRGQYEEFGTGRGKYLVRTRTARRRLNPTVQVAELPADAVRLVPEPAPVEEPCTCDHARADHRRHVQECRVEDCGCDEWWPKT